MPTQHLRDCLLYLAILGIAHAQGVITTVVGTDAPFAGDGQSALNASLGLINGIAVDHSGNVYFTDPDNHAVFRVGGDGIIHVIAGNGIGGYSGDGGPAIQASIGGDETAFDLALGPAVLNGIAVDANGNVFFATGKMIRRVDANGIITTYAGGGTKQPGDGGAAAAAQLGAVLGVAMDASGNLYFVDRGHGTVRKITADGTLSTIAGDGTNESSGDGGKATLAHLNNPSGIACDNAGNVYISESFPGRIRKITVATGIIDTIAGGGSARPGKGVPPRSVDIGAARAVAISPTGDLYTFSPSSAMLIKFAANGDSSFLSSTNRNSAFLSTNVPAVGVFINGIAFSNGTLAVDSTGNLFTAQNMRGVVRKIDPNGILTTVAGNDTYRYSPDGTPAESAQVRNPAYIAVGADGQTLYFLSTNGLRKIGSDGVLNTATIHPPFQATFLIGLTADSLGNLYTLAFNSVIRLSPSGVIQTVVNESGLPGFSGDNAPALTALLSFPEGLAADKAGNLFIADTGNLKIRRVGPDGNIQTIAGNGQPGHTGDGGPALSASFTEPGSLLADNQGGVYVIDGSYIRHVLANGTIQAVAGNGTSGFTGDGGKAVNASISVEYRSGMALDGAGNLYFSGSDFESHIRRIAPDNTITTVAGVGTEGGFAGDGGPAAMALLSRPLGLAMDPAGNLYVADSGNNRIRVILASAPALSASPAEFSFQGSAGGPPPLTQALTVVGTIDSMPFTVTQSADSSWLTMNTTSGVTPRLIQLQVDPSKLTAQTYQATLTVQGVNSAPIPITVSFDVGPGLPPKLSTDKAKLSFTYPQSAAARTQVVTVNDIGGGTLPFRAATQTDTGGKWLSVSPDTGTATPAQGVALAIEADPSGLAPGTYRGTVTIRSSSDEQSKIVPVTMTISAATQAILLSHSGLTFTTVQQGGIAPPQTFAVLNLGTGTMNWTASTTTLSGGQWLTATPASGSSTAGSAPPKVTVTVNQAGLAPGRYYGLVQISAPGAANTPHVITIFLHVLATTANIGPAVVPNELVFTATAGGDSPSSKTVQVYNIAAAPKTFSSSAVFASSTLNYLPGEATLALNAPTTIVVQPDTTGLTPGEYRAHLTLQFSDGRVRDVRIHIIVTNAPPSPADEEAHLAARANCSPTKLIPTLTSLGPSFNVPAGWPVALQSTVVDDCGNPLNEGSVVASFSNGDPSLSLLSLRANGQWQATWNPSNNQAEETTITLSAEAAQPALHGSLQVSGGLQTTSDAPQLSAIVSGASFANGVPLAPGNIAAAFGSQLADASGNATGLPLGTTLHGATVVIAGEAAPLYYASSGQLNAYFPLDVAPNTSQQVLISRDTTLSVPLAVDVAPAEPAIFPAPLPNAPNQGAIFAVRNTASTQTSFLAQPASPASAGDTLVIYCAGLGAVDQMVLPGVAAPSSPPANTQEHPQVTIGGKPAPVAFSGLTPGLVGVYQINTVVPANVPAGDQVPVVVSISGQTSPPATIATR